jgi:hypothetical protein
MARAPVVAAWTTRCWSHGPSRRALCASFSRGLDPYPGCLGGARARFFPPSVGLPAVRTRSAPGVAPHRDCRAVLSVEAAVMRCAAGLWMCLPPRSLPPIRHTLVWRPCRVHPSPARVVTCPHVGYASRPNRATDGRGLSPPRFAALSAAPRTAKHEPRGSPRRLPGRPGGYPPGPPQTRTSAIHASGSSVARGSAPLWRRTWLPRRSPQMLCTILGVGSGSTARSLANVSQRIVRGPPRRLNQYRHARSTPRYSASSFRSLPRIPSDW